MPDVPLIPLRRQIWVMPLMVISALVVPAAARSAAPAGFSGQDACHPYIVPAEQYYRFPPGLLLAIAQVESGRDGTPYPWALNIGGKTLLPADFASALRLLRDSEGKVRRDAAVGCMQIALNYHLTRLKSPEWALQPRYNVWYSALFLQELKMRYGDWPSAVAHYHASDRKAQRLYLCLVGNRLAVTGPGTGGKIGLPPCKDNAHPSLALAPAGHIEIMALRRAAPLRIAH